MYTYVCMYICTCVPVCFPCITVFLVCLVPQSPHQGTAVTSFLGILEFLYACITKYEYIFLLSSLFILSIGSFTHLYFAI